MLRCAAELRGPPSLAKARSRSLIADPLVVATGLQLVQAVGVKRALTLMAVVGGAMALAKKPAGRAEREVLRTD